MPTERLRRTIAALFAAALACGTTFYIAATQPAGNPNDGPQRSASSQSRLATDVLQTLAVKGRAPHTGYSRQQFGSGWEDWDGCDMRNHILNRDLSDVKVRSEIDCTVLSGILRHDPYTARTIQFTRGQTTSSAIQIDHIVAASDAWQKGAQQLSSAQRQAFYNDPLNLLAVDGPANSKKGDSDAASWLPPNKAYRCRYVARQIAVKAKYKLWVTTAEQTAMRRVLYTCPTQVLPFVALE